MDARTRHEFANQIGILIGFAELIADATPDTDPRHDDALEILRAAQACAEMLKGEAGRADE